MLYLSNAPLMNGWIKDRRYSASDGTWQVVVVSYGHMIEVYQVEAYRVLQNTHGVTLLVLNLPV